MCSYFGIILLHESGHAFFARKYGFTVTKIQLGFIHGKCEYEVPYDEFYELSDIVISWGGVIAQLIVAIPLIAIAQLSDIEHIYGMGPIVAFLGYISFMVAIVNLAPSEGLDGAIAWKIVPYILQNRSKAERNIKKPQYRSRPQAPEEIVRDFISRMKDDK
jgi:membrane-associated protease RseP (regulator of RpoE activity)